MARTWQQELHHNAKKRAKRKGVVFTVLQAELEVPSHCPLLGIPLMKNPNRKHQWDNSATVDRIDNSKGYTSGNVWVVSSLANLIMSSATAEQIIMVGTGLKSKQTEMTMKYTAMKYTEEQAAELEYLLCFKYGFIDKAWEDGDISFDVSMITLEGLKEIIKIVEQFDKDNGIAQ